MHWQVKNLSSACDVTMGQAPIGESYNDEGRGYPLIAGAGDFDGDLPKASKFTTQPSKVSEVGDIILGIRASIGEKVWSDRAYCLGRGVAGLRPKNGVSAKYVWHWLGSARHDLLAKGRGATFLQVNKKDIETLQIPLPPLDEQKRIAAILDTADEMRAKRRQSIAELDKLLQSVFLDMFGDPVTNPKGWEICLLGEMLEAVNYGTSKKPSETKGEFPILRMGNITYQGGWNLKDLKYVELDGREREKYLVHKGHLLFNRTNSKELVGKTAVYRLDEPMAFAGYLVRGITNSLANPEYIGAFMNTPQIKAFLRNKCRNIVGMANINAKEFQAIKIPKPPLAMQNRYADVVQMVEQQKSLYYTQLSELDTLFSSLQQRAFIGELSLEKAALC